MALPGRCSSPTEYTRRSLKVGSPIGPLGFGVDDMPKNTDHSIRNAATICIDGARRASVIKLLRAAARLPGPFNIMKTGFRAYAVPELEAAHAKLVFSRAKRHFPRPPQAMSNFTMSS